MDTIRGKGAEVRAAAAAPGVAGRVEIEVAVEVLVEAVTGNTRRSHHN